MADFRTSSTCSFSPSQLLTLTATLPNSVPRIIPILTSTKAFTVVVEEAVVVVEVGVGAEAVCINNTPASSLNNHLVGLPFTPVRSIPWDPRVFISNNNSSNNTYAARASGRQIPVAPIRHEERSTNPLRTRRNRSVMSVRRRPVPPHDLEVPAVSSGRWYPQLMLRSTMVVVEDKKRQTPCHITVVAQL